MKPPFRAYQGDDAYIFVCYSHADESLVYPELERLRMEGFNIWFDEGVTPGSTWRDEVANAINDAHAMLLFITPASASSNHCRKEIHYALESKPFVIVELEPTVLEGGLKLALSDLQAIKPKVTSRQVYEDKLSESLRQHVRVKTRVIKDQSIVYTDVCRFAPFISDHTLESIEEFLIHHEQIVRKVTEDYGGVVRSIDGDNCLLTFTDTDRALAAVAHLIEDWHHYIYTESIDCPLKIGMSRGTLHIFRSFVHGKRIGGSGATPIDLTRSMVEGVFGGYFSTEVSNVLVTNRIVEHASDKWTFKRIGANEFFSGNDEAALAGRFLNKDLLQGIPLYQFLP